jgi:nitroreductase
MDLKDALLNRRSVRKFKDQKIDRTIFEEIINVTRYAPSWTNSQTARWTVIDDKDTMEQIALEGVSGFVYNQGSLRTSPAVVVLSYVEGISGKLDKYGIESEDTDKWEIFDAGIACMQFTLSAYEQGISTCIMGVIDEDNIKKITNLPENEKVAAIMICGYELEHPSTPERKEVSELLRFIK